MNIITTTKEMREAVQAARRAGKRVALVPTMGNLHEGHLSLVRIAKQHADLVVVSIFVNPAQFGPNEDFDAYPRTFDDDQALCQREGVDLIFHPSTAEIYPPGASVVVAETSLSKTLCGASRPGHFDGVCTVVAKLFNATLPDIAVFGEKDAQQLRIIRRMVRGLLFPVEIVAGPTIREPDGLARSSRNRYLTPAQRRQAAALRQGLDEAERLYADGERNPATLETAIRARIQREPDARIDYVTIVDNETLQPPAGNLTRPALAALAAWIGQPRLIDNTVLGA